MTRPPYTATDWALAISALLTAALDLAAMFAPMPVDPSLRGTIVTALSVLVGMVIVSFTGHRAAKHVAFLLHRKP